MASDNYGGKTPKVLLPIYWLINAIRLSFVKADVFLIDSFRIPILFMYWMGIHKIREQKYIGFFGTHELLRLNQGFYSKPITYLYKQFIFSIDSAICLGAINKIEILKIRHDLPVQVIYNGTRESRFQSLYNKPYHPTKTIATLADLADIDRVKIKGIDLIIKAFVLFNKDKSYNLRIGGKLSHETEKYLSEIIPKHQKSNIIFCGEVSNHAAFFSGVSLYINASRYEAWGVSINEAMLVGIPSLVSEMAGAKLMVENINPRLTFTPDIQCIVKSFNWFYSLSENEILELSKKSKIISSQYSEKIAVDKFKTSFYKLL